VGRRLHDGVRRIVFNPFENEPDAFRVLVYVVLVAAVIIAIVLIARAV
jgi:hypothetical protein